MKVRKAHSDDKKAIVALVKAGLSEFGFVYSPQTSEADIENIDETYNKNGGAFIVIEQQNELVATGGLLKLSENKFKIRKMYVSKPYRNQGLGKHILEALLKEAKLKKAKEVVLETSKMMTKAILLYKSYGFEEIEGSADSPRCDIVMLKKI
jgi:N-acetylglutamate synthase-like GNAT family acetyltransferase